MASQFKIIDKFKPTKVDGRDFFSEEQVWMMIDMAYKQVQDGEEISEPLKPSMEFYCPDCERSVYSCRCTP